MTSFCWYELMTTDAAAAGAFYGAVVGWKTRDVGGPANPYAVFLVGETGVGGMLGLTDAMRAGGAAPLWIGYIEVGDVDDYALRVTAAGGAVHRAPDDIPGIGRFAMVADPNGAPFVLFKPLPGAGGSPSGVAEPGYIGWRELMAGDGEAAFGFYSGLFGWTKGSTFDMGPMGAYQLFADGGPDIGGMMTKPPTVPQAVWRYYFRVDGVNAAIERVKQAGGTIGNGPMQVPSGDWVVGAVDPQGAAFNLMSAQP